jgi:hypothetical protein
MWSVVVDSGLGHGILTSIASAFLGFLLRYLGISARAFLADGIFNGQRSFVKQGDFSCASAAALFSLTARSSDLSWVSTIPYMHHIDPGHHLNNSPDTRVVFSVPTPPC